MTLTIKGLNKSLRKYGVEVVKGNGYFWFADVGDECLVAHHIPSVYVARLRWIEADDWIAHVRDSLIDAGVDITEQV